jgi:trimethylamine:corrinoid methyltransferase-like protein
MPYTSWKNAGSKTTNKRAIEEASKLEKKAPIKPIEENLQKELNKIVKNHLI